MKNRLPKVNGLPFKHFLRLHGIPFLAIILNIIGISWKTLGEKIGIEVLIAQARVIKNQLHLKKENQKNPLTIAFISLGGSYGFLVDLLLGLVLKIRGHHVSYVLNDQSLPLYEGHNYNEEANWDKVSAVNYAFGKKLLESIGANVIPFSELNKKTNYIDIKEFEDIREVSLLRHYRVGVLSYMLLDLERRTKLIEESIKISANVGRVLAEMNFDRVIINHGLYSSTGPARKLLNAANVPVLTFDKGKKKDTLVFSWTESTDKWDVSCEWEKVKNIPLNELQESQLNEYLQSRISHENDTLVYNFGGLEAKGELINRLCLDVNKPIYTLFTNVLWDAASSKREIVFNNPIEWVLETIEWFVQHPKKQLLIKNHPAEIIIGTQQHFADIIKENFPELPANVIVIEPDEKINSWSVINITDLGIVHTSTVGMELPLENVACAVVSNTHYRNKGFTIDVDSKESYFQLLKDFNKQTVNFEENRIFARRYAYLIFERYQIPFPFFNESSHLNVRSYSFNSINELIKNESMEIIIKSIENHTPVFVD